MYDTFLSVIESGHYELADMLNKINTLWVQGELDDDQKEYLTTRARQNADPVNSYVDTPTQLASIFSRLHDLELAVAAINTTIENLAKSVEELGRPAEIEKPDETVDTSYPEYKQPTCAADCYNKGDTCTFEGKKYSCLIDGCVWNPKVYPAGWKLVEDSSSEEGGEEGEGAAKPDGTLENPYLVPVDFSSMAYKKGSYYREDNSIYLMNRAGMEDGEEVTLYYKPSALVGHYFEVVKIVE